MPARRCAIGCESWPDKPLYAKCPVCGEETRRISNINSLSDDEAQSILLHTEFERYYQRYCEQKGQPSEGALA